MPLSIGDRLGQYEILGMLGQGGMGEVYRAKDTTLKRDVALKALPSAFLRDPGRLARFQREAEVLASLDHPNIGPIYGMVESEGVRSLVLALIEGPTLEDRIAAGPVPQEEAIAIARQIADALEYAHDRGVIHRDLKPANIKITPEGGVKVLDFGLAKVLEDEPPVTSIADSPTLTLGHTRAGVILGTAAYMSPEQAVGRPVDRRSDIFSFGAVLFEMLTGRRAFAGAAVPDVLEAVVKNDPDWSKLPAATPGAIQRLLRRCLTKDRKQRLQAIGEARIALENPDAPEGPQAGARSAKLPWAIAAALGIAALVLGFLYFRQRPPAPPEVMRFQIRLPEKVTFSAGGGFTLSPDGRHLAFSAVAPDNPARVWIEDLDALEARPLSNTFTGPSPPPFFWSPDSRFVVYSENSPKLKKVDVFTGMTQDIGDKPGPPIGGSWNSDGTIIFGSNVGGLWRVPAAGGKPVPLTKLDAARHEREHELPSFLPDGKHFLYLRVSTVAEESGVFVGSIDDSPERQSMKRLLATSFGAYYVDSIAAGKGWLLFFRDGTLMAQPFNANRLELSGDAAPVAEGVGSVYETPYFSASPNAVVYRTANSGRTLQLTWFDSQGKPGAKVGEPGSMVIPRLSPDGTRVVFRRDSPNLADEDLWLLDLARGSTTRFTFGPGIAEVPLWSPDGNEIVFSSNREGVFNLYRKPANGAKEEELLLRTKENKAAWGWSRDGRFLVYSSSQEPTFVRQDLWVLPMQGDHTPIPFLQTRFNEGFGSFSPDGRWIAYDSDETGRSEVYVRPFTASRGSAETSGKWIISKDGGQGVPRWRDDGKEIVYTDLKGTLWAVALDTGTAVQARAPRQLFRLPLGFGSVIATGDLKRFLIPVPVEQTVPQAFNVMLNWTSVLKTQ